MRRQKLSNEEVLAIYDSQEPRKNIAADFKISQGQVSYIKRGKRRAYVIQRRADQIQEYVSALNAVLVSTAFCPLQKDETHI